MTQDNVPQDRPKIRFQQIGGDWAKGEMDAEEFWKNKTPATTEDVMKFMNDNPTKLPPQKEVIAGHLEIGFDLQGNIVIDGGKQVVDADGNWHLILSQRQAMYLANLLTKKVYEARHDVGIQTYES